MRIPQVCLVLINAISLDPGTTVRLNFGCILKCQRGIRLGTFTAAEILSGKEVQVAWKQTYQCDPNNIRLARQLALPPRGKINETAY
jgi:hypothetical protein